MKLELWVYKMLLQAYPKDFRLEFETEMLQVFRLQIEDAKLEQRTLMFWVSVLMDCVCNATRERFSGKGENMNWLQRLAVFFSLLFAFEGLLELISKLLHFETLLTFISPNPIEIWLNMFYFVGIFSIYLGMFASLPKKRNFMEHLSISTLIVFFILTILPRILKNSSSWIDGDNIFSIIIFVIGFLGIAFARIKIENRGVNFSEIPFISKIFSIYFLISFLIPAIMMSLLSNNSISNLSYLFVFISLLGYLVIAFGIWRSNQTNPSTPNLSV